MKGRRVADRAGVVDHYKASRSLRQTGLAFGISQETVRQIVLSRAPDAIAPPYIYDRKAARLQKARTQ